MEYNYDSLPKFVQHTLAVYIYEIEEILKQYDPGYSNNGEWSKSGRKAYKNLHMVTNGCLSMVPGLPKRARLIDDI